MQPQAVRGYLNELKSALAGVPEDVARDILDGVAEELAGLDSAAAATRIEEVGDPAFIAAEARAESAPNAEEVVHAGASPGGDPRWYTVLASLLVAFGGAVVPLLGWVFGIAMVWMSKTWRTWEKWVATASFPVIAAVVALLGFIGSGFTAWHLLILLALVGNVVVGFWLLWRGLRSRR